VVTSFLSAGEAVAYYFNASVAIFLRISGQGQGIRDNGFRITLFVYVFPDMSCLNAPSIE
jgi:hypothetical protein